MITTTLVLFPIAIVAGVMGAILGLGGGIIIVPALTLLFHLPMRTAVAASTVSIIATSTGAAVAYLNDRLTNIRVAMWLEMGTATGAMSGALVAGYLNQRLLFILFGALLGYSGYNMVRTRGKERARAVVPDRVSRRLRLAGSYYDQALDRQVDYQRIQAARPSQLSRKPRIGRPKYLPIYSIRASALGFSRGFTIYAQRGGNTA